MIRFALCAIFAVCVLNAEPGYVGSEKCGTCHASIFGRWKKTRMANVVQDPKVHPEAVLPDFGKADPLLTFGVSDVAFTYGSKWKQRYFQKIGKDYFPLPAQWDVKNKVWRAYNAKKGTDWWTAFYPAENSGRPTGPLCDGCHSVNYDTVTQVPTEWNVGCERCHGPGGAHVERPSKANIVNSARLAPQMANDVCISCHSQGQPLKNPIAGRYYDWPVGYAPGKNLQDFWKLEEHRLGETTFTHYADGTGHKNRMQGNDFTDSLMYRKGVTCSTCHDVHGTDNEADLIRPASTLCLTCHQAQATESHSHHKAGSQGSECIACHMPKIEQTIADVNVRSHTFRFVTPAMTEKYAMANPCTSCHKDQSSAWATGHLKQWYSPWRMQ